MNDEYISFNGKNYRDQALIQSHPELKLNLNKQVRFGVKFPANAQEGDFYIRSDMLPTKLFRFNGMTWDPIDKNILSEQAYSSRYIKFLVDKVAKSEYNPELLNYFEKSKIRDYNVKTGK